MHVVNTTDLTKIYEDRYIALNALNLRVEKGMVFGLVGPNGAGKSTTFRLLLGLQRPTAGNLEIFGESMSADRADLRRRIGYLPTNPTFPRHMTPISFLEFVGAVLGMPRDRAKIQLARLLQAVDLTQAASQKVSGFSTGMLTRLGIAAALMNDPELLILDEPTSGLDPAGRKQTIELIRELSGRDRTIIIATHILTDAERVCTDVGIISQGRLIYSGPMSEMRRLARQGTIAVEIEGNTLAFEQQLHSLDELGSVRYERLGSEFRITFLGTEPLTEYLHRVLQLIDRTGVELLHIDTGSAEIEEAFLRRLEDDRTRGFLRVAAWAAAQEVAHPGATMDQSREEIDAGVSGNPSV
ncbi:MAG: ABC transporter ATP-binding protein [Chloroflexi bacterium]|nr:ABC transporter ATP-binding protein [Chloroflexota bacterium]MQC18971.1 ABC transporter ATP-binding protein [Chloroflexota bacterium]